MLVGKKLGIPGLTGDVTGLRGLKFGIPDLVLIISEKFYLLEFLCKNCTAFLFFFFFFKEHEKLSRILKFLLEWKF